MARRCVRATEATSQRAWDFTIPSSELSPTLERTILTSTITPGLISMVDRGRGGGDRDRGGELDIGLIRSRLWIQLMTKINKWLLFVD